QLGDIGVTTPIALLITFLLGIMVGAGYFMEGVAGSILVTAILISKAYSKQFSEALRYKEMISALQFGIIAFVLYPIVPNEPVDPFGIINPKILVFVTIVASSIGFVGYIALQKVGYRRGLAVIGALGGLLNSEATATILSSRVREKPAFASPVFRGILFTNVVMMLRNLVIAGAVSVAVMKGMLFPQLAMVAVGLLYLLFSRKEKAKKAMKLSFQMPFAIKPAALFAIIFILVSWGVSYLRGFGITTIYFAALLGGLVSAAATTASFSSLYVLGTLDVSAAAAACVLSAIGSTFSKIVIGRLFGTKSLFKKLLPPMLLLMFVGIAILYIGGV
ncbi:MAG: MgtC/SapB family protein, partial [Candidatus Hydrothermarchaeaceae archaeon]